MAEIWTEGFQKQVETLAAGLFWEGSEDWAMPAWYRDWPIQLQLFDTWDYYVDPDDDDWWDD